jgi:hypothetical protein
MGIGGTVGAGDVEALYEAAGHGDAAKVSTLLDSGVNVNGRTGDGNLSPFLLQHISTAADLAEQGPDAGQTHQRITINF